MATNQSLKKMFSKLKVEMVSKFVEKLEQQMNRTDKLEQKLERQANRINQLEGQIALQKTCQISWKSNMATMNITVDVPVFEFMESKYQRMNLLIM